MITKVEELFPLCLPDNCPVSDCNVKILHHHILPSQKELLESNERIIAMIGGFGSSKTLGACVLGHLLSMSIPGNMGLVCRRSLPKLHDSTERMFLEVLQRSGVGFQTREMRDGWPGRVIYSNGSEVAFRETKDIGRFLGPEYGWFFIDEAQEEPERTFRDLLGRLRLPRARLYLRGMLATNPPSQIHWIAKLFPQPGTNKQTVKVRGKQVSISYRMIRSSTYDNPFLSHEYVATLLQNMTPAEARRVVEGYYGFQQEGKPVYPTFDFMKHVGDPPLRRMTLYRVWDFGFHCPAVTFSQLFRCTKGTTHWLVLQELIGENIEALQFGKNVLIETASTFKEHSLHLLVDGGDAAGAQVSDKGPGPIIRLSQPPTPGTKVTDDANQGGLNLRFRYRKFHNVDPGLDLVRDCLKKKCACGFPVLMIHRRCQTLIEALSGGYHYARERPTTTIKPMQEKPVKDGFYDNVADALRYTAELFYRPLLLGQQDDMLSGDGADSATSSDANPWGWMERMN